MSGRKWEEFNSNEPLCTLCSVARGTIYATQPCPTATREAHAERLRVAREEVEERLDQMTTLRFMGAAELALVSAFIDAKIELALLERGGG